MIGNQKIVGSGNSGPRSNRYSQDRFTNWSEYEPWWLEVQAVFHRFDSRIAKHPKFPKVIGIPPLEGFERPCSVGEVEDRLRQCPTEFIADLRAVFILAGTRKQVNGWRSSNAFFGHYWRRCVFLHAYPFYLRVDRDWMKRFYLRDVLIHEIGHHVDTWNPTEKEREKFADRFARLHG